MYDGGDIIMLKVKEFLSELTFRLTKYLTPVNYLEYSMKMLFILKIRNLRLFSYILLLVNLVIFTMTFLFKSSLNPISILISGIIQYVGLSLFIAWRKKIKGVREKTSSEIQLRELELPKFEVPTSLKKFTNRGEK